METLDCSVFGFFMFYTQEEAKASLKPLREKLESFQKVKQDCEKALEHIKVRASQGWPPIPLR